MSVQRQLAFWLATFVVVVLLLWLLSDILLPFIAGMAIAYLLDPLTNRLERIGINRRVAAILIVGLVVLAIIVSLLLIVPVLAGQLYALIGNIPGYVTRVQALLLEWDAPWLRGLLGPGGDTKAIGDLVSQGAVWLAGFLRSLWAGGRSLISIFSLVIVTPVVAYYLICDWPRVVATIQEWIPLAYRDSVHGLLREIDAAIAG